MAKAEPVAEFMNYYNQAFVIMLIQHQHPFRTLKSVADYITTLKKNPNQAWNYFRMCYSPLATKPSGLWVAIENNIVVSVIHQIGFVLDRIATHPQHLRKGYARALLKYVTEYYEMVVPDIPIRSPVNHDVIPLFKSAGWGIIREGPKHVSSLITDKPNGVSLAMYPLSTSELYKHSEEYFDEKYSSMANALLFHSYATINTH